MTAHTIKFFDLTREGWIPCLDKEGRPLNQQLGLRDIFEQAHHLADLNGDNPLVDAALYRLLLAILHRNFQNTETKRWSELWEAQYFDMHTLNAYFDEWQDQKERFYLFHPTHPFYQSTNAYGKDGNFDKGVAKLVKEVAMGDDSTLFSHNIYLDEIEEGNLCLDLPTTTRMLVTTQSYKVPEKGAGPQGGEKNSTYTTAPLVDGIVFFIKGENLFETLMLNLLEILDEDPFLQTTSDKVVWERQDAFERRVYQTNKSTIPDGYLDYLTWQNCRVLLDQTHIESKKQVSNIKMSLGMPSVEGSARKRDPFKSFAMDSDGEAAKTLNWQKGRSLWRDGAAIFNVRRVRENRGNKLIFKQLPPKVIDRLANLDIDRQKKVARYICTAIGMSSNNAKVDFYRREEMPLPIKFLQNAYYVEKVDQALMFSEKVDELVLKNTAETLVVFLLDVIGREADDLKKRKDVMKALLEARYWPNLTEYFYHYINVLQTSVLENLQSALDEWQENVERIAKQAIDEVTRGLGDAPSALKAQVRAMEVFRYEMMKLTKNNHIKKGEKEKKGGKSVKSSK